MFQLGIVHSNSGHVKDLDSYLAPSVPEMFHLAHYGFCFEDETGKTHKYKVQLLLVSGDSVGIKQWARHGGSVCHYGCRICKAHGVQPFGRGSKYFPDSGVLRTANEYRFGDPEFKVEGGCIFTILPTFDDAFTMGLDELHLICEGVCKQFYYLIMARKNCKKGVYHSLQEGVNGGFEYDENTYTFNLTSAQLEEAAKKMENSRCTISASFEGRWEGITRSIVLARGIDFLDWMLYAVPSIIVPMFGDRPETQKPIMKLVEGLTILVEWHIDSVMLDRMDKYVNILLHVDLYYQFILFSFFFRCLREWHDFLKAEIEGKHLCVSVFTSNQHTICHLKQTIKTLGPLRAYSTRSLERTIGRYKKYITAKNNMNVNVGKALERLAIRDYFIAETAQDVEGDVLDMDNIKIRNAKWNHLWDRGGNGAQLWGPLYEDKQYCNWQKESHVFALLRQRKLESALRKFYKHRYPFRSSSNIIVSVESISIAARAWYNNNGLNSAFYFNRLMLSSKSNECVLIIEKMSSEWFVGSVLFYFKYTFSKTERYLALVKITDEQVVLEHAKSIPVVSVGKDTLYFGRKNKLIPPSVSSKYIVIEVEEIFSAIGLVQCPKVDGRYKVISPKLVHNID
jgi:hypothetical protein